MGQATLKWCDNCGTKTDALTIYWQLTDSASRTTESSIRDRFKLELCDRCYTDISDKFLSYQKFTTAPKEN